MFFESRKAALLFSLYMTFLCFTLVKTGFFPSLQAFDSFYIFYHTGTLHYEEDYFGSPEFLIRDNNGREYVIPWRWWISGGFASEEQQTLEKGLRVRFSGKIWYDPAGMIHYIKIYFIDQMESVLLYDFMLYSCVIIVPSIYSISLLIFFRGSESLSSKSLKKHKNKKKTMINCR